MSEGRERAGGTACPTAWLVLLACLTQPLSAQLTTGVIEGTLRDGQQRGVAAGVITIEGRAGLATTLRTDQQGYFSASLPYGQYKVSGVPVNVSPLQTTHVELRTEGGGTVSAEDRPGLRLDATKDQTYPEGFNLATTLLDRDPASVTQPLGFNGLNDNQLTLESQGGVSWTDTRFTLQGMDATDSYQPGHPAILPNIADMDRIVTRNGFSQSPSANTGTEVGLFLSQPDSPWHATLTSTDTGTPLASSNLPATDRGMIQQDQYFKWLTRDGLEIGGPIRKWADVFLSAWGQWDAQTEALQPAGTAQSSRLLFANARGRIRLSPRDQIDALYLGSRIDLNNWGTPDGIEALAGNRGEPSFTLPGGFAGQEEVDHLDFIQAGWSHLSGANSRAGTLQVRYGYSAGHLDSDLTGQGPAQEQSVIELTSGAVTGAPPLGNFAIRTRQSVESSWEPRPFATAFIRHRIAAGGGFEAANPRNRFTTPSNMNLITANGAPAFVVDFNTPADTSASVRVGSAYLDDQMTLGSGLTASAGILAERSTGSVNGVTGTLIAWNSLSPRTALAWTIPHSQNAVLRGATLRVSYARLYSPLAGRYLDYGDPNALSGQEYRWNAINAGSGFADSQRGPLLMRFGGEYSSISPTLRQPYSDHFNVGADVAVAPRTSAGIQLFRVDATRRIGALDTGVPAQDFSPVTINDPGPDGIPGTFDDSRLTVYAQNPTSLGRDRYLLTNPAGLNARNLGFVAEAHSAWKTLMVHASFTAEKSEGPTNPGDAVYENDPGVLGSLLLDPNTNINANNRSYMDRAYVGKLYGTYRLPWLGIDFANTAVYMDGLVFGRELVVTGLPQGPFMVAATVRGSPEGGNRAEHIVNWNSGLRRTFQTGAGTLTIKLEVMNVANGASKTQESDVTGHSFNLRLPLAIQAPRYVTTGFALTF